MSSQYPLFTPVQYAGESTYGISGNPDTAIGSVQSITPTNANSFTYIRANNRAVQKAIYGQYTSGLTGSYFLHSFVFLQHFIGEYDDGAAGTEADPYTLTTGEITSTSSSSGIQSFSLEIGNTIADTKTTYVGCQGNDFTLSGNVGQALQVSFNIIAQKPIDSSSSTSYVEPTTLPYVFSQAFFKYGSTPTEFSDVESFSIAYNNNLIQNWAAGNGRFMKQPLIGQLDITWTITLKATSSYYQNFRDAFFGTSNSPIAPSSSAIASETDEFKIELREGTTRQADIHLDKCMVDTISDAITIGTDNVVIFTISGRSFVGKDSIPIKWWNGGRS